MWCQPLRRARQELAEDRRNPLAAFDIGYVVQLPCATTGSSPCAIRNRSAESGDDPSVGCVASSTTHRSSARRMVLRSAEWLPRYKPRSASGCQQNANPCPQPLRGFPPMPSPWRIRPGPIVRARAEISKRSQRTVNGTHRQLATSVATSSRASARPPHDGPHTNRTRRPSRTQNEAGAGPPQGAASPRLQAIAGQNPAHALGVNSAGSTGEPECGRHDARTPTTRPPRGLAKSPTHRRDRQRSPCRPRACPARGSPARPSSCG